MECDDCSNMTAEKEDGIIDEDYHLCRLGGRVKDNAII